METCIPFGSIAGDRRFRSGDFADLFKTFFTNGVSSVTGSDLMVEAATGLNVLIRPGCCCIDGRVGINKSPMQVQLANPNGVFPRIDRVVQRLDMRTRWIEEAVITGEPGEVPIAPVLTRTDEVHEICLADIAIAADTTTITTAMITDTRVNTTLCGFMGVLVPSDMGKLYDQFKAIFTDWIASVQYSLSGDVAANLATQIAGQAQQLQLLEDTRQSQNLLINGAFTIWQAAKTETLTATFQRVADGFYAKGNGLIGRNMNIITGRTVSGMIVMANGPVTIVQEIDTTSYRKTIWTACEIYSQQSSEIQFGKESFSLKEGATHKLAALPVDGKMTGIKYFSITLPAGTFYLYDAQAVEAENKSAISSAFTRPYMQELELCKKYYREIPYSRVGTCISTAAFMLDMGLFADMVAPPAITLTSKALVKNAANNGATQVEITGVTKTLDMQNRWLIQFNKASLTLNNPIFASVELNSYTLPDLKE